MIGWFKRWKAAKVKLSRRAALERRIAVRRQKFKTERAIVADRYFLDRLDGNHRTELLARDAAARAVNDAAYKFIPWGNMDAAHPVCEIWGGRA